MQGDFLERVYAGVLGKIIGVYLGRPFEGWSEERISRELGDVRYYVNERLRKPLVVPDDDISGTFAFLRAIDGVGTDRELTPRDVGSCWLNELIEGRTVLWWGGMGTSTEHTAYLRLAQGIEAPESGSAGRNGRVVAEQIGAQIFIDGWAMLCPGDPERAARLAEAAARVSHDGEAVHAARVVAAMEALAFTEGRLDRILDESLRLIPDGSVIARLIRDLREWRAVSPDWREGRRLLGERYGYSLWGGGCHVVPNHGVVILSLLYGGDDFQRSLMVAASSGWDTDCNAGNVGCFMGIKGGLAGIDAGPDWRGPVADRLYLPTADGGGCITDAAREAVLVANRARRLQGLPPIEPKQGARFHFELPGSLQGFTVEPGLGCDARLENVPSHSLGGTRSLAVRFSHLAPGRELRFATPTFIPPTQAAAEGGYGLLACPTLHPGQRVRAAVSSECSGPLAAALYLRSYAGGAGPDVLELRRGPSVELRPLAAATLEWTIPELDGSPVAEIGVELTSGERVDGALYLDSLDWSGEPRVVLRAPARGGTMWSRAWVNGADHFSVTSEPYRVAQDRGRGLVIQGSGEWRDYRVSADVTPHAAQAAGIAARVRGMRRYYALLIRRDGSLVLVKALDGERILARESLALGEGETHRLELEVSGGRIRGGCDGRPVLEAADSEPMLRGGAVALVCEEGRMAAGAVSVEPAIP